MLTRSARAALALSFPSLMVACSQPVDAGREGEGTGSAQFALAPDASVALKNGPPRMLRGNSCSP